MTVTVKIHDANIHLSRMIDREGIVVARAARSRVGRVPFGAPRREPPPELAGLPMPQDMLAPMSEDELAEWE
jgi:hypothetical protein